jgi:hypothetical protein
MLLHVTGVVATTVAAPFDTLKSRVMVDDGQSLQGLQSLYAMMSFASHDD